MNGTKSLFFEKYDKLDKLVRLAKRKKGEDKLLK